MNNTQQASLFEEWRQTYYLQRRNFESHTTSYIDVLLPEIAVQLDVFEILRKRLGDKTLTRAFNLAETIGSPFQTQKNGDWLKQSNIIWEPGVVASLYGKTSFVVNEEFYSKEWAKAVLALNTAQKQLKALVNVAHAMGKAVGMDVIPYASRFAKMVFTHPRNFEWVKQVRRKMISHGSTLYQDVEEIILQFLHHCGTTNGMPILTGDKDDPRFDSFFRLGNILRYFTGMFYTSLPSYYSLGFETRGQNLSRNLFKTIRFQNHR
ncbi:MAG: hypothetical protein ACJA1O_003693 [Spirosomataceae bacterium]|jgi:hypothetical protein